MHPESHERMSDPPYRHDIMNVSHTMVSHVSSQGPFCSGTAAWDIWHTAGSRLEDESASAKGRRQCHSLLAGLERTLARCRCR